MPETLVPACQQLEAAFTEAWADPAFRHQYEHLLRTYANRPSLSACGPALRGARVAPAACWRTSTTPAATRSTTCWARRCWPSGMGKTKLIAETAGQHGWHRPPPPPCSAWSAVYMGEVDMARQANVPHAAAGLGGAPRLSGSRTLKDAERRPCGPAADIADTHYLLGSVMGPHPYPWMVREFHRAIGDEAREQCRAQTGGDPDVVVACVGGGSNAIGIFSGFAELPDVRLVGVDGRRLRRAGACPAWSTAC
ncbi:MAG: pyridoxal-phosphate dependent enzyme [Acidimicrobiales bacterium]